MKCQICNKNDARVHVTEMDSQQKVTKELHICDECAKQKGIAYKVELNISDLLSGFIDPNVGKTLKDMTELKCPVCGMSYAEFRAKARLGCANDYETFDKGLLPLIEKIHGGTQHCGKHPRGTSPSEAAREREIRILERRLEQLVKTEKFEDAARVRDQIRSLKSAKEKEKHDA